MKNFLLFFLSKTAGQAKEKNEDISAQKQDKNEEKSTGQSWLPEVTRHNPAISWPDFRPDSRPDLGQWRNPFFVFKTHQQSGQELAGFGTNFFHKKFSFYP